MRASPDHPGWADTVYKMMVAATIDDHVTDVDAATQRHASIACRAG
jgi:hypothetical protein